MNVVVTYDIPYLAGYSQDGNIIYISRHFPREFKTTTNKLVNTYKYLVLHELVEKSVMDNLRMDFNSAHKVALGAESALLKQDHIPIDEYYAFIGKWVEFCLDINNIHITPANLDLTPYIEDGLDDVVARVKQVQEK